VVWFVVVWCNLCCAHKQFKHILTYTTLSLSLSLSHTHTHTHFLSLSLSLSLSHTHTHTHTHTHFLSLTLSRAHTGQLKTSLEHYSGDYETYQNTLADKKIVQARARVAYEKEKEKLKEFVSREGKKYDNPAHQSQRKMKLKQLEALVEVESVEEDSELVMIFPTPFGVFDRSAALLSLTFFATLSCPGPIYLVLSCFNSSPIVFQLCLRIIHSSLLLT
jgi:ABC transporter